jgi:hypothetical protein
MPAAPVVLWAGLGLSPREVHAQAVQAIPEVHATSLAGDPINLPEDLKGRSAVLVMGFSHGAQDAVRAWSRSLAADYRDSPAVTYYELAMLGGAPRLVRGLIVRSMKKEVPERAQGHFVPITDDEAAWKSVAHYDSSSADAAYVVVLDRAGNVVWRTSGPLTGPAYVELKRHLP